MDYKITGSKSSFAKEWFLQRITGVALVIFLIVHFWMKHPIPEAEVTYEAVVALFKNPLWKLFDLAFLVFALYHGLNGAWSVIQDYKMKQKWSFLIYGALFILGTLFLILGSLTIITF